MFLWLLPREWYRKTLRHRLLLRQKLAGGGLALVSGVPNAYPVTFARAPNGWVFMTNGLMEMRKWNGVREESLSVGLTAPTTAPTIALAGNGEITGVYTAYARFVDEEGNYSNLSPISNSLTVTTTGGFTYTNVPVTTDPKVTRRQLLRNTNGQALTYYVDVDTTDLAQTTFSSTRTDVQLLSQTSVALFDAAGRNIANRYTPPRTDKPLLVSYLDRMIAAGEVTYDEGHIEMTHGSATVTGVGTNWQSALVGRLLYLVGHDQSYQITAVNVTNQTLTVSETYKGTTDKFLVYTIRSAPAERKSIYFTEAGLYDAWPATNGFPLEENGDEITSLLAADSFLYVFQRRHVYRISFHKDPNIDGGAFLSARRGCLNNRSWAYVDGMIYALDEDGIYRFDGGNEAEAISTTVQDLFWLEHLPSEIHINWEAQRFFHCQHHKEEQTIRWFICLAGFRLPRHAICFSYRFQEWWLEEYSFPIGSSTIMEIPVPRPLAAGPARRILTIGPGTLDGVTVGMGTTRGTATAATIDSLSDALAVFPTSGVVGYPVAIVDGRGKGQQRLVTAVSGTTVRVAQPWTTLPDTTSIYQLGGISWLWRSGWLRWVDEELANPRAVEVIFQPCLSSAQLDLRIYENHRASPNLAALTWPPTLRGTSSIKWTKGDADRVVDLTDTTGYAQLRLDDGRERHTHSSDAVAAELRGISAENPIRIYAVNVDGAE